MITTDRPTLLGALLVLASCSTTSAVGQQVRVDQPSFVPRVLDEPDTPPSQPQSLASPDAVSLPPFIRVMLLPDEAWTAKEICEVAIPLNEPNLILWRLLPTAVHGQIRDGGVPDSLHAYVDDQGIVDCVVPGCWTEKRVDARGCVFVCQRQNLCVKP